MLGFQLQSVGKINTIRPFPSMADRTQKLSENVSGKFYVDTKCIDCDLCRMTAPANYARNEAKGYSYVSKQPATRDEEQLCVQAKEECPVDAIGDDGEDDG